MFSSAKRHKSNAQRIQPLQISVEPRDGNKPTSVFLRFEFTKGVDTNRDEQMSIVKQILVQERRNKRGGRNANVRSGDGLYRTLWARLIWELSMVPELIWLEFVAQKDLFSWRLSGLFSSTSSVVGVPVVAGFCNFWTIRQLHYN
jgi:hypothetical protein